MKPKLLVLELWGLGDLAIATPFLRAASRKFDVTLVSKQYGCDLQLRFWPGIKVLPFAVPWTVFKRKYRLHAWPWRGLLHLRNEIRRAHFDVGVSARWDPRDHVLLNLSGARQRLGYARMGSRIFLTQSLPRPEPSAHRSAYWQKLGQALALDMSQTGSAPGLAAAGARKEILIHSGAGQPVRVWPLQNCLVLAQRLRKQGHRVQIVCDPDQRAWWLNAGEHNVTTPHTVTELLALLDCAALFIGNDSGPGHIAALADIPTFTIFGPQLSEWFAPSHPAAEWTDGRPCPYKPCSDYCRWAAPKCLTELTEAEVGERIERFVARQFAASA